ncbi:MAG: hypothetical protein RL375_4580 [Pseudomonadota bacterium]|jgi:hypothetical protein
MQSSQFATLDQVRYEIRFESLFHSGRGVSFPCDAQGRVKLDGLSERARSTYQRAKAMVGFEYATPAIVLSDLH